MNPIPISQATQYFIDGGECYLYPDQKHSNMSCAYVVQDSRYPVENFKMNTECTESFFIIDGEYTLTLGHETHMLQAKDVVHVPLNTPYSIEGKGTSFVFIEPNWKSEQNIACDQEGNPL